MIECGQIYKARKDFYDPPRVIALSKGSHFVILSKVRDGYWEVASFSPSTKCHVRWGGAGIRLLNEEEILCVGELVGSLPDLLELKETSTKLGAWMSAALDDPNVCDEMKSDIQKWFNSFGPIE